MEKLNAEYKIKQYEAAVDNFKASLAINTEDYESSVADTLKSGQVQKFEVCAELMLKAVKVYLLSMNGIDSRSPKQVIKEFYNLSYVSVEDFEAELAVLDDRNSLSHVYSKEQFEEIYIRVQDSLPVFQKVLDELKL
ncbi:MAG: HI0074 family nucleotidyltransferase substrate-binding subunit [Spirochaetales bacterium]|nr:HI0074 family nucleotidyltransferase substrate-binding subunit [Spirochaetales bacterium]